MCYGHITVERLAQRLSDELRPASVNIQQFQRLTPTNHYLASPTRVSLYRACFQPANSPVGQAVQRPSPNRLEPPDRAPHHPSQDEKGTEPI